MSRFDRLDDPRRRVLIEALAAGLLASAAPSGGALAQTVLGRRPARLPPGQSIYRISGTALVNGRAATLETPVRVGDTVRTGKDSELVFAIGDHAMLLRGNTHLVIEEKRGATTLLTSVLRLVTGMVLSVSRNKPMQLQTNVAVLGIRGTGWYAEAEPEQTYFCTCYGTTDVAAKNDPTSRETVVSKAHDRPLYILGKAPAGRGLRAAPFINHTDQELMLIETLVGRTPPFVFPKDDYSAPRRDY